MTVRYHGADGDDQPGGGPGDPTSASPISFTAVFSEAVSGFAAADVAIGGTAGGTKTVTILRGPAPTRWQ